MALFIGRVVTGAATAGFGAYLYTKYGSETKNVAKRMLNNSETSQKDNQSPLNFIINVPDNNSDRSSAARKVGAAVFVSGIVVALC